MISFIMTYSLILRRGKTYLSPKYANEQMMSITDTNGMPSCCENYYYLFFFHSPFVLVHGKLSLGQWFPFE